MKGILYDFDVADVNISGDGFSGPYEEFGVKTPTRLGVYCNFYRSVITDMRPVKITAEIRCNYELWQGPYLNFVMDANVGKAKRVEFSILNTIGEYLYVAPGGTGATSDAFLQIRVLKIESINFNDPPVVFPDGVWTESENTYWVNKSTTMYQTPNVPANSGPFTKGIIDNQNVALIAVSQVCRLTKPELGAQVGARIINRRTNEIASVLADAKKQAQNDGATNVVIEMTDEQLLFTGRYED